MRRSLFVSHRSAQASWYLSCEGQTLTWQSAAAGGGGGGGVASAAAPAPTTAPATTLPLPPLKGTPRASKSRVITRVSGVAIITVISEAPAAAFLRSRYHCLFYSSCGKMVKAQKWVLAKHFVGEPKDDDLKLEEEELPAIKDGEILVEAEFWSVDPYMRPYAARFPVGITMIGSQVAKIVESKAKDFPEGRYVVGYFGWRTHTVHDTSKAPLPGFPKPYLLPEFKNEPYSLALGALGMPGNTAYFGFLEICQPKEGETVVVSGAAGAVGSLVGQIAKIKGCRVVGFAGSDDKVKWLKEELGFDAAYNYKTKDVAEALKEGAPKGVDCYFDNVGGEFSSAVLNQMNPRGRISVCGSISAYNADPANYPKAPLVQPSMVFKELRMEGFIVHRWEDRWMEGIHTNLKWIREGKLKYRETVTEGFKNMPKAFKGMLKGENTGKAIIKA